MVDSSVIFGSRYIDTLHLYCSRRFGARIYENIMTNDVSLKNLFIWLLLNDTKYSRSTKTPQPTELPQVVVAPRVRIKLRQKPWLKLLAGEKQTKTSPLIQ